MSSVIDSIKKDCRLIHFFGLGFIQVKTHNPSVRWHFYHPELPAYVEDPHNHRYDFTSTQIYGRLKQTIYEFNSSYLGQDKFQLINESCQEGKEARIIIDEVSVKKVLEISMRHSVYTVDKETFHTIEADPDGAITYLQLGPKVKEFAQVLRPLNKEKVCPFSKKYEESYLWDLVEDLLNRREVYNDCLPQ